MQACGLMSFFASSNVRSQGIQGFYTKCILSPTVYAAITAASLSLLATGIDAVFDIGSNVLLFWLHKKAGKLDLRKWPVGGARLETIGNIVYGE